VGDEQLSSIIRFQKVLDLFYGDCIHLLFNKNGARDISLYLVFSPGGALWKRAKKREAN
jgi:hypothetical protein